MVNVITGFADSAEWTNVTPSDGPSLTSGTLEYSFSGAVPPDRRRLFRGDGNMGSTARVSDGDDWQIRVGVVGVGYWDPGTFA
jgi:hypothetical protein